MSAFISIHCRQKWAGLGLALGAALLAASGGAISQGNPAQGAVTAAANRTLEAADQKFVTDAARGGLAEVGMGQMAQERGRNPQVKAFGERMVRDHGKANEDLKQVATAKGVALPTAMGPEHQQHADRLGKLSGIDFDRAYMKHMVDDHKKDMADFEKAAKSAKDADVKDFAARTLPTLKEHGQMAQTTFGEVREGR